MTDLSSVVAELDDVAKKIGDLRRELRDLTTELRRASCLVAVAVTATKEQRQGPAFLHHLADSAKELLRRQNESEVPF